MTDNKNDLQFRQLRQMKLQTVLILCIFLVILFVGIFAFTELLSVRRYTASLRETLSSIDTETVGNIMDAFSDAGEKLNAIDTDELNALISSLRAAADNLQGIDAERLNELIASLEGTASALQGVTGVFGGLFGR